MAERTLLVLAASTYQLDAIRTARALGLRVITTDNRPDNPGHRLADAAFDVDTTDRDGVLALARRENVAGVLAPATDVAVETAAQVAEALGLPGVPPEAAATLTSKLRFRAFLHANALPCPAFAEWRAAGGGAELRGDGPWIVKPNRASGSKGIRIVANRSDLERHGAAASAGSLDARAIVEQCIEGSQHTCEGFLANGRIAFSMMTDRSTAPWPHVATAGHFVPSRLPSSGRSEALRQLARVFAALGVRDGPFDCDFVAADDRIVLLEATPRLGGNLLSALVEVAFGCDLVEAAVRCAVGDPVALPHGDAAATPSAVLILGVATGGHLRFDARALRELRDERWVRRIVLDKAPGATVAAFVNGRERVGEAAITGASRDEVDRNAIELLRRLRLDAVGANVRASGSRVSA